jgi:hypothetical protein
VTDLWIDDDAVHGQMVAESRIKRTGEVGAP